MFRIRAISLRRSLMTHTGSLMIRSVDIKNFRCFKDLVLSNCRRFNVIVGDNGVGKTALLEAIFLALGSSPALALRFRQARGLDGQFGGSLYGVEEAMWRNLFYMEEWNDPISVRIDGDGQDNRSVTIARGDPSELILPFDTAVQSQPFAAGIKFVWRNSAGREVTSSPKVSSQGLSLDIVEKYLPDFFYFAANQ